MQIEENVPLAPYTTFKIGGPARYFARAQNIQEIVQALDFAKAKGLRVLILGGGSNVLVDDAGFDGLVIKIEITGIVREGDTLVAAAGEQWDALCQRAAVEGLWGIENLSGIPGTVGGAVAGSIGAYGAAVAQTLAWVEVLDTESGAVHRMSAAECRLGYRSSFFTHESRYVILRAAFTLSPDGAPNTSYKDLADCGRLNIPELRQKVLDIRKGKFPDLAVEGTAGSYFKNPIMPASDAARLKEKHPDMPLFDMPETEGVKVPLAWLLDKVLHLHGTRVGGARLFEKQPLVIAATGASAHDVRTLATLVKEKVRAHLNVEIEEEVHVI